MICVLLLHHKLWTNFLSAKKKSRTFWLKCMSGSVSDHLAPRFSQLEVRWTFTHGKANSTFQWSLKSSARMHQGVVCQITHSTFQHAGSWKHLVELNSARAARIGSICRRLFLTFFFFFFFMSRNCQQCTAHPPRSRNATGAGAYGTSMRNNLAEVSVSLQSVMRWYCESWKTPGT